MTSGVQQLCLRKFESSESIGANNTLQTLPEELVTQILDFLPTATVMNAAKCSRKLYKAAVSVLERRSTKSYTLFARLLFRATPILARAHQKQLDTNQALDQTKRSSLETIRLQLLECQDRLSILNKHLGNVSLLFFQAPSKQSIVKLNCKLRRELVSNILVHFCFDDLNILLKTYTSLIGIKTTAFNAFFRNALINALLYRALKSPALDWTFKIYYEYNDPEMVWLLESLVDFEPCFLLPNREKLFKHVCYLLPFCSKKLDDFIKLAFEGLAEQKRLDVLYELACGELTHLEEVAEEDAERDVINKYLEAAFKIAKHFKHLDGSKYNEILFKVFEEHVRLKAYMKAEHVARCMEDGSLKNACIQSIIKYPRRKRHHVGRQN